MPSGVEVLAKTEMVLMSRRDDMVRAVSVLTVGYLTHPGYVVVLEESKILLLGMGATEASSCVSNLGHLHISVRINEKKGLGLEVLGRGRRSTLWTRRQGAPSIEVTAEPESTTIKVGVRDWRHWEQRQAVAGHGCRRWRQKRGRSKQRRRWRTRAAVQFGSGARRIKDEAGSSWRLATKRGGGAPGRWGGAEQQPAAGCRRG